MAAAGHRAAVSAARPARRWRCGGGSRRGSSGGWRGPLWYPGGCGWRRRCRWRGAGVRAAARRGARARVHFPGRPLWGVLAGGRARPPMADGRWWSARCSGGGGGGCPAGLLPWAGGCCGGCGGPCMCVAPPPPLCECCARLCGRRRSLWGLCAAIHRRACSKGRRGGLKRGGGFPPGGVAKVLQPVEWQKSYNRCSGKGSLLAEWQRISTGGAAKATRTALEWQGCTVPPLSLANECLWGRGSAHSVPPARGTYEETKTKKTISRRRTNTDM